MLVNEKFYRISLIQKFIFFLKLSTIYFFTITISFADLENNLINKITTIKTLSFNFEQKISEKEEFGKCVIKYPLLMKCEYNNFKKKIIISNGRSVAVIKKKYKKIYNYPIQATPLFVILQKEKILNLIRSGTFIKNKSNLVIVENIDKKGIKLKILFDNKTFNFKGWETTDAYSNPVSFIINDLIINKKIEDIFFKIPLEEEL